MPFKPNYGMQRADRARAREARRDEKQRQRQERSEQRKAIAADAGADAARPSGNDVTAAVPGRDEPRKG
jgi:hypothetical protein